jgi:hypothetical protein
MKNKPLDSVLGLHAVHKLAGDVKATFDTIVRSAHSSMRAAPPALRPCPALSPPTLLSAALLCSCAAQRACLARQCQQSGPGVGRMLQVA